MADARMSPEQDGLSDLFGAVVPQETGTTATPATPAVQYTSRRAMREAEAAALAAHVLTPTVVETVAATEPVAVAQAEPVTSTAPVLVVPAPVAGVPAPSVDAASAAAAEVWTQLAATVTPDTVGPSRRELRDARTPAANVAASSKGRKTTVARVARAPKQAATRNVYRAPKKRASALVVMVAVCGLFATAALPAFAFSGNDDEVVYSKTDAAAESSLTVKDTAASIASARGDFTATTTTDLYEQQSNAQKAANFEAYMKSGAREAGDDYPYFSELSNNQGGGLSPLNYFYRECVDFVAWRLNRDAGSTEEPYLYDWSYLTPAGGNAYQWKSNWEAHGWETSNTPKAGSVAWFGYHVGYVKSVNKDGTVTIEEYNHNSDHIYGQRTIPATDVTTYLYAPPR